MPNRPSMKHKSSFTIRVPIGHLRNGHDHISPDHAFDGLIWRVHVQRSEHIVDHVLSLDYFMMAIFIDCEGDGSRELWRTNAKMQTSFKRIGKSPSFNNKVSHVFASWGRRSNTCNLMPHKVGLFCNTLLPTEVVVVVDTESDICARRPILDAKSSIHDMILVLEEHKFPVNKQILADQSSYFNRMFFGDFMESKQEEIEIKDTDSEDFDELLKMIYGVSSEPTTVDNAIRYLDMADKFDIQIVKDRVENFLVATDLITIHRKLLIADEYRLEILKDEVLLLYKSNNENVSTLWKSPEFTQFSKSLKKSLFVHVNNFN